MTCPLCHGNGHLFAGHRLRCEDCGHTFADTTWIDYGAADGFEPPPVVDAHHPLRAEP